MTRLPASEIKSNTRVWVHRVGPWLDVQSVTRKTCKGEPAVMIRGYEQGGDWVDVYVGVGHVCWTRT